MVVVFQFVAKPALDVLRTDRVDFAEFTAQDHFASLANEWIAGVVVSQSKDDVGVFDRFQQLFGLIQIERHRFVTDDVEASFDGGFGDFEVRVVGRGDADEVDSLVFWQP